MTPRIHYSELVDPVALAYAIGDRYVRRTKHPNLDLSILNYTQSAQFDRVWTPTTRVCRGIIVEDTTGMVVARPWPKFHNYGEHRPSCPDCGSSETTVYSMGDGLGTLYCDACKREEPYAGLMPLDLTAPVEVTDKMDGSLGIVYPLGAPGMVYQHAVATRGSFSSDQALIATGLLAAQPHIFDPDLTYLVEIIYPENRVVLDYGDRTELVLLGAVKTATGASVAPADVPGWVGARVDVLPAQTLAEALTLPARENAEGVVVRYLDSDVMVKIKQDDYVALHRIMTGTNARHVWEYAAVRACTPYIDPEKPRHWGTYLGIAPERAAEIQQVGPGWLDGLPDEFYGWVSETITDCTTRASQWVDHAVELAEGLGGRTGGDTYQKLKDDPMVTPILRHARTGDALGSIIVTAWKQVCPDPTAPFDRSEDVS